MIEMYSLMSKNRVKKSVLCGVPSLDVVGGKGVTHPLKNQKILLPNEFSYDPCSQGKLIVRPSLNKIMSKSPVFLEIIHGDICGPIHPPCGPFRYFVVLIDASTR